MFDFEVVVQFTLTPTVYKGCICSALLSELSNESF